MRKNGVKCSAIVHKEHSYIVPLLLHMGQCSVEGCSYGILCGSVSPVCKLVWVQTFRHQFFKAFHHHRGEGDWPVVVEDGDVKSLRQGDDGGGPQGGWDSGLGQGLLENPREDRQLICTGLTGHHRGRHRVQNRSSGLRPALFTSPHGLRV